MNTQNPNDKGLSLEPDTDLAVDDAAFDDVGVDEELDGAMAAPMKPKKSRGTAKLLAGVVVLGLLGVGGYVGYKQVAGGGAASPSAAVPTDVPAGADSAAMDPMAAQPLPGADMGAMPADPAMADPMAGIPMADGTTPPTTPDMPGAVVDGGMPMDGGIAMDAGVAGDPNALPPAVPLDGGVAAVDPMAAPIDPMADPMAGIAPPATDPVADAGTDAAMQGVPMADAPVEQPAVVDAGASVEVSPGVFKMPGVADAPAAPVQDVTAPEVVTAAVTGGGVDAATADAMQQEIRSLRSRVQGLIEKQDALQNRLNDVESKAAAAPAAASVSDASVSGVSEADLKALERRIDDKLAKLATAQAAKSAVSTSVAATPTQLPTPKPVITTAAPRVDTTAPRTSATLTPPATATIPTAVRTGATSVNPMPNTAIGRATAGAAATTTTTATTWQLRSAQPGRAWLAKPGSQEMRSVGVGDEVPGLGRILSIALDSTGRWSVRGTMGTVAQ